MGTEENCLRILLTQEKKKISWGNSFVVKWQDWQYNTRGGMKKSQEEMSPLFGEGFQFWAISRHKDLQLDEYMNL